MADTNRPVFVFVPGACHTPEVFDPIRDLMSKRGLETDAVALPSVGAEPPTIKGLHNDIDHVHATLERLADEEGRRIVVVAHSYGGAVGGGAVRGLEYPRRAQSGEKGGVIMLVYMTALVLPKGWNTKDMIGGRWFPWMKFNGDYCYSSDEETIFYSDLSPTEQKKWIAKLKHISVAAFLEPATHEPWHDLPCMYLLCENDLGFPIAAQEKYAEILGRECTTFRCGGSHSAFLSMPEKVIEGLELAAKVGAEKCGIRKDT